MICVQQGWGTKSSGNILACGAGGPVFVSHTIPFTRQWRLLNEMYNVEPCMVALRLNSTLVS